MTAQALQHPIHKTFIPQLADGRILCMPQGGPIQYAKAFEAERHTRLYEGGWCGHAVPQPVGDVI